MRPALSEQLSCWAVVILSLVRMSLWYGAHEMLYELAAFTRVQSGNKDALWAATHGKGHKNNSGLFQIWRDLPCFSGSSSKKKGFNLHVGLKIIVWCKDCVKSKLLLSCFHGQYTDRLPKTEWIQAPWNCLKSHCSVSIMNTDFNFCMV